MREIRSAGSARGDELKKFTSRPVPTHHNLDQDLLMRAVKKHAQDRWVVLYIERWLKAPMQEEDGRLTPRAKGTPQGGVISPLLANLFLHYGAPG